jgi:hypothetical protein
LDDFINIDLAVCEELYEKEILSTVASPEAYDEKISAIIQKAIN